MSTPIEINKLPLSNESPYTGEEKGPHSLGPEISRTANFSGVPIEPVVSQKPVESRHNPLFSGVHYTKNPDVADNIIPFLVVMLDPKKEREEYQKACEEELAKLERDHLKNECLKPIIKKWKDAINELKLTKLKENPLSPGDLLTEKSEQAKEPKQAQELYNKLDELLEKAPKELFKLAGLIPIHRDHE